MTIHPTIPAGWEAYEAVKAEKYFSLLYEVKLAKTYELMENEYERELLTDVAKEIRRLVLLNGPVRE